MGDDDEAYGSRTARYYDAVYGLLRAGSGDIDFYRTLARETGGPVLELGCGSGRVLLPIAREGFVCAGLDASRAMLDEFQRKKPPGNLRLTLGRMEDFDFGRERFSLVYSAFRAFQHLMTVGAQLDCLAAVRRHLAPHGVLAFDVFAPILERIAVLEEPESEDARFQVDGADVIRHVSVRRDPAIQVMDVSFRYERRRPGAPPENEVVQTRMRYFFRYELEHLLARSGFGHVQFFGGFDRRPYDYFSGETVVMARAAA